MMSKAFEQKVVVVTGAAKGIGEATVRAFHNEGAWVVLLDIDETAKTQGAEFGESGMFVRCDVSKGSEVERAFQEIISRFGGVDVLVNNAGIQHYGTVTSTSEEEWDMVMRVNLKSAFLCAKSAIPSMLARGGGVVINLSSVQAFLSQPNVAPYTTSKTAMLGLTRSIAIDYAPTVRCVAVCPGTVDTPMLRWAIGQTPNPEEVLEDCQQMHLVKRIGTPGEVANLILFLASDKAAFITGQYYRIDGGFGIGICPVKRA
jgi:NAD(P)-dependent dehydrogenase (short-subunit alcohol dehydrogenase family)